MKKLLEFGNRFAGQSDWTDFALTKLCLCSLGLAIGTAIPKKHSKCVQAGAGAVFFATYAALIAKMIVFFLNDEE